MSWIIFLCSLWAAWRRIWPARGDSETGVIALHEMPPCEVRPLRYDFFENWKIECLAHSMRLQMKDGRIKSCTSHNIQRVNWRRKTRFWSSLFSFNVDLPKVPHTQKESNHWRMEIRQVDRSQSGKVRINQDLPVLKTFQSPPSASRQNAPVRFSTAVSCRGRRCTRGNTDKCLNVLFGMTLDLIGITIFHD